MSEEKKSRFKLNPKKAAIGVAALLVLVGVAWIALSFFGNGEEEDFTGPFNPDQVPVAGEAPAAGTPRPEKQDEEGGVSSLPPEIARPNNNQGEEDGASLPAPEKKRTRGLTFVDAVIEPLQSELDRFWGWRPNDLIQFTDNVNNFQLGVLEATRRTSIVMAERISRTGSSDPYVRELEQAMSLFAIDPTNYMFPAPESKYKEGLENLREYQDMLRDGTARFYNRMDNLVPLLLTYESLLGSCTENLLKRGVGFFEVDDIFFYSQGVASMILSVMEGAGVDFRETIEGANSVAVYKEIVRSLREVVEMDPWIVLRGGPHSIFANHRANMAGPMSRARFHMSILHGALTGNL